MTPEQKRAAGEAHAHADELMARVEEEQPGVWDRLDGLRANPPAQWPDWCLLPMAAPATIAANRPGGLLGGPAPATMAALYAWRFARSVWLFEPSLLTRLLRQVPDAVTVDDFAGLPEWCVYITEASPEFPGVGVWAHLEADANTGRPELRLLLDNGDVDQPQMSIPVYLDRGSTTEALGDYRATTLASMGGQRGTNVRGGQLDAAAAALAEQVDGYLGVLAYLARPQADIQHATRYGLRPVRPRRPKKPTARDVWLVGYADT